MGYKRESFPFSERFFTLIQQVTTGDQISRQNRYNSLKSQLYSAFLRPEWEDWEVSSPHISFCLFVCFNDSLLLPVHFPFDDNHPINVSTFLYFCCLVIVFFSLWYYLACKRTLQLSQVLHSQILKPTLLRPMESHHEVT